MLYIAFVSHSDRVVKDDSPHEEWPAFLQVALEAFSLEDALDKLRRKLVRLHDEDELFYDVYEFYLDELVEIGKLGPDPALFRWMSVQPFGDGLATLTRLDDGEEGVRCMTFSEGDSQEPFLDIRRDRRVSRPLLKEFRRQKERGVLPSFDELTDGDLYALYVLDGCIDGEIADLFEVKRSRVTYRRRKVGAGIQEEALVSFFADEGILDVRDFADELTRQ